MSKRASTLMREASRSFMQGRSVDFAKNAVDPYADTQLVFVGLDMYIRGQQLSRLLQNFLQIQDGGRVFARLQLGVGHVFSLTFFSNIMRELAGTGQ